jgi:hypothetical protein
MLKLNAPIRTMTLEEQRHYEVCWRGWTPNCGNLKLQEVSGCRRFRTDVTRRSFALRQ